MKPFPYTNKSLKSIKSLIKEYTDLNLSLDEVKEVMEFVYERDPDFWYAEFVNESWEDIHPREMIIDGLALKYVGMTWPCNGDYEMSKNKFYNKLEEIAKIKNWNT